MSACPTLLIALVAAASLGPGSLGPAPAAAAEPAQPESAALAAHRLGTAARAVLDRAHVLDEDHAAVAERLLALAVELAPSDTHAWNLRLEALELLGDREARRAALRAYLQHERHDDAAQLKLIDLLAEREATVADRLTLYERLLGEAGAPLSRPLRSRVAYRASLLHREQGRRSAYAERLREALSLDESNPAAAAEALAFLQQRGAGDVEMMQTLLVLLNADPGNSATHERIARRLLAGGQYLQSATWLAAVSRLWEAEGAPGEAELIDLIYGWALALWGAGESGQALELIQSFGASYGVSDVAELPVGLQLLRAAMLHARQEQAAAEEAFDALADTLQQRYEQSDENPSRLADLAWAHLLLDQQIEAVEGMRRRLETQLPLDDPMVRRIRIWQAARLGEAGRAKRLLDEAEEPTLIDRLGAHLAMAEEMDRRDQVDALRDLLEAGPDRLAGVWAADGLRRLDARPQPTADGRTVGRLAQAVPDLLREGAAHPAALVELGVTAATHRVDYARPIELELELRNRANVPLSLGRDGAVAGTVMLLPRVHVSGGGGGAGESETVSLAPQLVDMTPRLRLEGGRSVSARVRLDQPDVVELLDRHPTRALRLTVTAVLNPRLTDDGRFLPGVFGDIAQTDQIVRTTVSFSDDAVDAMIDRLAGDDPARALSAAARLIGLTSPAEEEGRDDLIERSVEAVTQFFVAHDPPGRAFILAYVLRDEAVAARFAPIIEQARDDESPVVQAMLLAAGPAPDSVAMEAALEREDGVTYQLARHIRRIFAEQDDEGDRPEK